MMNMLGLAGLPLLTDEKRLPDASNPRGYFEWAAVRQTQEDASWAEQARGKAVKVIHRLLPFLPDGFSYRVILMHRPAEEVVRSQDRMLERLGADPSDLPTARIQEIFKEQHEQTRSLLESEPRFDWIEVEYPALIKEPLPFARKIIQFLDLDTDPGELTAAVDPELYRERP